MIRKLAWIFAIALIAVGILGFIPGITSGGNLLGIFAVDTVHNLIHLVSGIAFLIAVKKSASAAKTVFKVFGVIYGLVAVIGLFQGDTVLGLITTNMADHVLHIVIAAVALFVGFKKEGMPATTPAQPM
jgi:hypothetical protein